MDFIQRTHNDKARVREDFISNSYRSRKSASPGLVFHKALWSHTYEQEQLAVPTISRLLILIMAVLSDVRKRAKDIFLFNEFGYLLTAKAFSTIIFKAYVDISWYQFGFLDDELNFYMPEAQMSSGDLCSGPKICSINDHWFLQKNGGNLKYLV